jgi:YegS/Rv2252/BmrU family lipid kinase
VKIAIILNGISNRKKFFYSHFLTPLREKFEVKVFETEHQTHAFELAERCANNFDVIIAAGGDGTLHQALNGILQNQESKRLPILGVIPLGTANDFARTCRIRADVHQLISLLDENRPQATDVGRIACFDEQGLPVKRFFINACSVGMGPEVVRRLSIGTRKWGPSITYFKAIMAIFFTHKPQEIHVTAPAWQWIGKARVVAITNGRSFGNALQIAPGALIDDGILSGFIVGELPLLRFLVYLQLIKKGKKIVDPHVHYYEVQSVQMNSSMPGPIEADGELAGVLPATVGVVPQAFRMFR